MTSTSAYLSKAPRSRGGMDAHQVLSQLDALCSELKPGGVLPGHTELMSRYDASERTVRWAIAELQRQGKISRRRKAGTVVAEAGSSGLNGFEGNVNGRIEQDAEVVKNNRTVVAIATSGQSVFDRALHLLIEQAEASDLSLTCRLFHPVSTHISKDERPLGYVLFGRDLLPLASELQKSGHRAVVIGTPYAETSPDVPCVYGDQEHGGYLATRHLLDLGHRRLVFRGGSDWKQMRRYRGHQQAIAEARRQGLSISDSTIFDEEFASWRHKPELVAAYFRGPQSPTAIIAWNDQTAMSLLSLLSYVGVRVPNDVSLVGYDNLPEGQDVHPQLTTVDIALSQQIRVALRLLTQPEAPITSHTVMITSSLVCRDSTAPPL